MSLVPRTVADLFAPDAADFAALPPEPDLEAALRQDVGVINPGLLGSFTFAGVLTVLYKALDLELLDVLRAGWASAVDLQEFRDPAKHPPHEEKWVKFGKHKLTSEHAPKVEVLVNGQPVGALTFDVTLELEIAATSLRVQDGCIWEAAGTAFTGEATIAYKGFTLVKKEIASVQVPGGIKFEDGIRIPPLPVAVD